MASDISAIKRKINKIRDMQRKESEKKGQRIGLMERLEDEFQVTDLEAGADLLEEEIQIVEDNNTRLSELEGELDEIIKLAEAKD